MSDLFLMSYPEENHYKLNFMWTDKEIEHWQNEIKNNVSDYKKNTASHYIGIHFIKKNNK
jgi:hypothetical protein